MSSVCSVLLDNKTPADLQVQPVVDWIRQHPSEPQNIAVQMPDALLSHAAQLYRLLMERLNGESTERTYRVHILADTTYARCTMFIIVS